MATGVLERTDLYDIWNVVQNTQLYYPKELIIGILRDEFKRDSYYHFQSDQWGFPLVPDHTDLPLDAGFNNNLSTRLFIGEIGRKPAIFYPAILVRTGGSTYTPISFNRDKGTVKYEARILTDGYSQRVISIPTHMVLVGAWEGSISVDIITRDIEARDHLTSICNLIFTDIRFEEFLRAGVLIKKVSAGAPSESKDLNDQHFLYKQSISLDIRTEWRREIPIENVIDSIRLCVEFGNLSTDPPRLAPNLEISTHITLSEQIENSL